MIFFRRNDVIKAVEAEIDNLCDDRLGSEEAALGTLIATLARRVARNARTDEECRDLVHDVASAFGGLAHTIFLQLQKERDAKGVS